MIYCCGNYWKPDNVVVLPSDFGYRDCKVEVVLCPKCNTISAVMTRFNVETGKYETFRPKKKKTAKFLREVEAGKWQNVRVKYGTRERAGFIYGVNKELKDGRIFQYSVDFNGSKKLTKILG